MQSVVEKMTVQVDENGRITLPAFVREQMHILPGTTLIVEATEEAELHLRVALESDGIVNKDGLLVITSEPTENIEDAVERSREERIQFFLKDINP